VLRHTPAQKNLQIYRKWLGFLLILFIPGALAAVPLRAGLLLYAIDPKTGFYTQGSSLVAILNGVLAFLTAMMLLPELYRRPVKAEGFPAKSIPLAVTADLLALLMVLDSGTLFVKMMFQKGGVGAFLCALAELAAAAFFFLFARAKLGGAGADFSISALLPVLWAVISLVVAFMNYTTISNISECLIDILKMIFVMIFFYYFARYAGGCTARREIVGLFASGLPAALFCLVSTLPHYAAYLISPSRGTLPDTAGLVYLAAAALILTVLTAVYRGLRADDGESAAESPSAEA
jgi:hypothetical protein